MTHSPGVIHMAVLDDWEFSGTEFVDWCTVVPEVKISIFTDHLPDPTELIERLTPFEIVMVMRERTPVSAEVLNALPNLRLIVTTGMKNAAVDTAAARARGVIVSGTAGTGSATPELAWGLILSLCRQIPQADAAMHAGRWEPTPGLDLRGSTLGLVGLGRIGAQVAAVAHLFGLRVLAWSPNLTPERAAQQGAELVGKHDLFAQADVVSVHMVLADSTRALIGATELRAMKPEAYLVNTSRGSLIDQAALLRALHEGWIAGAGLDVYDVEPLPREHPLRTAPHTVLTPHLGYVSRTGFADFYQQAAEDVRAYLDGAPVREIGR